jgi:hypothetical protein
VEKARNTVSNSIKQDLKSDKTPPTGEETHHSKSHHSHSTTEQPSNGVVVKHNAEVKTSIPAVALTATLKDWKIAFDKICKISSLQNRVRNERPFIISPIALENESLRLFAEDIFQREWNLCRKDLEFLTLLAGSDPYCGKYTPSFFCSIFGHKLVGTIFLLLKKIWIERSGISHYFDQLHSMWEQMNAHCAATEEARHHLLWGNSNVSTTDISVCLDLFVKTIHSYYSVNAAIHEVIERLFRAVGQAKCLIGLSGELYDVFSAAKSTFIMAIKRHSHSGRGFRDHLSDRARQCSNVSFWANEVGKDVAEILSDLTRLTGPVIDGMLLNFRRLDDSIPSLDQVRDFARSFNQNVGPADNDRWRMCAMKMINDLGYVVLPSCSCTPVWEWIVTLLNNFIWKVKSLLNFGCNYLRDDIADFAGPSPLSTPWWELLGELRNNKTFLDEASMFLRPHMSAPIRKQLKRLMRHR